MRAGLDKILCTRRVQTSVPFVQQRSARVCALGETMHPADEQFPDMYARNTKESGLTKDSRGLQANHVTSKRTIVTVARFLATLSVSIGAATIPDELTLTVGEDADLSLSYALLRSRSCS